MQPLACLQGRLKVHEERPVRTISLQSHTVAETSGRTSCDGRSESLTSTIAAASLPEPQTGGRALRSFCSLEAAE